MEQHDADKVAKEKYAVKGNDLSGFKNVSPEYMTYSSDLGKPSKKDSGKKGGSGQGKKDEDKQDVAQSTPSRPSATKS